MRLSVAIVGGGPSAFYVATRILHLLSRENLRIHVYDRLWAPHGLVRYGVAPDHPEVKNCTHKFDATAADPRVRFFGNIKITRKSELMGYYSHLVFATGAPIPRLHAHLPHSSLSIPALDIVHWYTMHPTSPYSRQSPIPQNTRHISLIGHGNVSLDVARILLTNPTRLAPLDIPAHVLSALHAAWPALRHVSIVGRRGPRHVRFTAKELREMIALPDARMHPVDDLPAEDWSEDGLSRPQTRVMRLLKEGSSSGTQRGSWTGKTFSIDFWRAPTGYTVVPSSSSATADADADARVALHLEKTRLEPATGRAVGTGTRTRVSTDLVVTSLGYEGDPALFGDGTDGTDAHGHPHPLPLPWYDPAVGHIRTAPGGRALGRDGRVIPGVYASGWAAHGARGVLAGTLLDANDVAGAVVQDWKDGECLGGGGGDGGDGDGLPPVVEAALREGRVVEYGAWRRVEEEERRRGGGVKERERMTWGDVRRFLGLGLGG